MKKVYIILFLFSQIIQSQSDFSVEKFKSRFRLSGESMNMDGEPNIGMMGIGYDVFGLIKKYPNIYLGANSYSAMSGDRAGVFSFGVSAGYKKTIIKNSLFADFSVFVGGGGGGGAPDGGGLIIRPSFELEKRVNDKLSLRAGISRIDFPSGTISSTHVNFGLVLNGAIYFANEESVTPAKFVANGSSNKIRASFVNTTYSSFQGAVVEPNNTTYIPGTTIRLIGAEVDKFLSPNFYASVEFNGAVTGGIDGYMSYFLGGGFYYPFWNDRFFYDLRILAGSSGGGGVASGGGASFQFETGFGVKLLKSYELKILGGKTIAPWGTFEVNHFDIVLGKNFEIYKNEKLKFAKKAKVDSGEYRFQEIGFSTFNRTYIPPRIKDKKGNYYDKFFNLIGFELSVKINNYLSLIGSTIWAYQGSYGAYGEGWLGLSNNYQISDNWQLLLNGMVGAAGGGDINLGSGLLFQYSVGAEKVINDRLSFMMNVGQVRPLEGNFTPVHIDLGIKLKINKLIKIK